jgi:protein-S-isoprenylcysteine O-methyltransferase Ste14
MTRIKLFMVVGAFMMGLIYFQPESAILLTAQLPATEVIAGIIVVLGTVGFSLRYYQMKLAQDFQKILQARADSLSLFQEGRFRCQR